MAGILCLGTRASAAPQDVLTDYQTTYSTQTATASVSIVAVSAEKLRLRYSTQTRRPDGGTARRVTSDVTVPLSSVTIARANDGIRFSCRGASSCISWTHIDFYSDDGAKFGNAGTSAAYGIVLTPRATETLLTGLCPLASCN